MAVKRRVYRNLKRTLWCSLLAAAGCSYYAADRMIPDQVSIVADEEETFQFHIPGQATIWSESEEVVLGNGSNIPSNEIRIQSNEPFMLYSAEEGSYTVQMKLFGWLKFKDIQVDVVNSPYAVPCGFPVGIYLKSNGVMVVGTGKVKNTMGMEVEPAYGVLRSGDYIQAVNGQPMETKEKLVETVNAAGEGELLLDVRRGEEIVTVRMNPVEAEDGSFKLGAWVRDDTQGIGTMTYMDLNGNFGALGHGISDSDTGEVVAIEDGSLYETEIMGIEKGSMGKPGVLSGVIYYGNNTRLGEISENTEVGVFGKAGDELKEEAVSQTEAVPVGFRQDVREGKAVIRSSVSGEMKDYEIMIQKVDYSGTHKTKGMVIEVTDPELLSLTGGIVQGMSGSPILQNGKLVGAVTHVFVQDSSRGYGIFMEEMMKR